MARLILIVFLLVISDPYKGINYNQVNVYDVNYCDGYYCPDRDPNYYYDLDKEEENFEEEELPLMLNLDFLNKK